MTYVSVGLMSCGQRTAFAGQRKEGRKLTSEVEPTSECAAAPGNRALEVRLVPSAARASRLRCARRDGLLLDLEDGGQACDTAGSVSLGGRCAHSGVVLGGSLVEGRAGRVLLLRWHALE